jgi:hypothetical protein
VVGDHGGVLPATTGAPRPHDGDRLTDDKTRRAQAQAPADGIGVGGGKVDRGSVVGGVVPAVVVVGVGVVVTEADVLKKYCQTGLAEINTWGTTCVSPIESLDIRVKCAVRSTEKSQTSASFAMPAALAIQ